MSTNKKQIRKMADRAVLQSYMTILKSHIERDEPVPVDVAKDMLEHGEAVMKSGGHALKQNLEDLARYLREYVLQQLRSNK